MTLEALFSNIAIYHIPLILILLASPWVTYLACYFIPGKREEPYLLSINLGISMVSMLLLSGYLAYVTNCLLYTSPSPRDLSTSRMPSSA